MSIKIGSLFAGIGGFELGLERAIPGAQTIWQVEKEPFCQSILKKHWPHAQLYDDVCAVGAHNLPPVDILCGGFPCQDISIAGSKEGLNGKKSGLWFEMRRIISELRPPIIILENVSAILVRGLSSVLADLAALRYDAEWCIASARDFGAPHLRERWFCVAYTNSNGKPISTINAKTLEITNANSANDQKQSIHTERLDAQRRIECGSRKNHGIHKRNYWQSEIAPKPVLCELDDGISKRLARLRALGNAIVPQCSQWIGEQVYMSGLLNNQVYLEPREHFDACIVAVRHVVIYSGDMIIEMLMNRFSWSHIDALEWFCYNIEPSQADHWPQFVWDE
jgi:DNA (cytosine-5)-methyltransferase 1